jgi:lactate dehydrogenase-like 2-hydroxyacid dehydrogenase
MDGRFVSRESVTRPSVFVAVRLIEAIESELKAAFDATFAKSENPLRELRESGVDFDVVLFSLDLRMQQSEIESLPDSVRVLATYSVGTDHIDLAAARNRKLVVLNTPGVLADSVAENAIFLMLGAARRATESIELVRSRAWSGWTPTQLVGVELSGRTLGVLGMGDIGTRIAVRASALGMDILYSNRKRLSPDHPFADGFRASARELVRDCDVLLLACPSTEETRGIIDASLLSGARPGSILINIARGDLVVDDALCSALRDGRVWAAGLDVFDGEPDIDPAYFDLPNVFMLPHVGSSTFEARIGMGRILIRGIESWQAGGKIANRVE